MNNKKNFSDFEIKNEFEIADIVDSVAVPSKKMARTLNAESVPNNKRRQL